MAIRSVVSSAVLGLLFISLLVIYLLLPSNGLVMFLAVLIMLVSLIVAQSQRWRDIGVMAAFAAMVSIVASALFGRAFFGGFGSLLVPVLWAFALLGLFSWTQRNMLPVPRDRAILILNRYTGSVRKAEPPIEPPLTPSVERMIAEIPLYELSKEVHIEKINTKRFNVDFMDVHINFRVTDPKLAMTGMPNRGRSQFELAKSMSLDISKARRDLTFWEKLFGEQMEDEVEHIVRGVLFDNAVAQTPLDAYSQRGNLDDLLQTELGKQVSRWGVEIVRLEIERIEIDPAVRQRLNKAFIRDELTLEKQVEAQREATRIELTGKAQAEAEAARVREMVRALQESGVDISPEALREIVVEAIHAATEASLESMAIRPMS
jgi:regulator of protease activity HflC (stomatin/prohibitin superfamily)